MTLPHGITRGLASAAQRYAMDQLGVECMGASKAVPDFLYRGIHAVGHRVILPIPLGKWGAAWH